MNVSLRLFATALCLAGFVVSDAFAGGGKGSGKNSVDVANGNSFDDENGDIQVWLLSEEDKVPETKADADALVSVVVTAGPFSRVGFLDQEDGTYILVAANKTAYESLDDGDTITAGQEYSAIEVVLAGGENKKFTVSNDPKGGPPLITEGILPPPGGPGGPGSDG